MTARIDLKPGERARRLRREAEEVLELIDLKRICAPIGDLIPTGSYFMDLMAYPDVDLYLPATTPEVLMSAATNLAGYERVRRINYLRGGTPLDLKNGLGLLITVDHGQWERPWKMDIWSLPAVTVEQKQAVLIDLRARMTPEQRALIIDTKCRLLTDEWRTPQFSGIHIYRAVIDRGLTNFENIVTYLRDNGVVV